MGSDFKNWMWFEAVDRLSRAQRMHQQFFLLKQRGRAPSWEPPADVLETDDEVMVFFALPGVDPDQVQSAIEGDSLVVAGQRVLPEELRTARIHCLELPQGRFERRIPIPHGRYDAVKLETAHGCLLFRLHKSKQG
jgi:HSP20 family molecular chaperone IbpA